MERIDPQVLQKHWRWEKDREGLVWLTFDKQGESANTFSRQALEELRGARLSEDALRAARGDARHHAGVARRAMAAEAGRPRSGLRHAADRKVRRCKAREAHRPRRPGGAAARAREYRAHGDARSAAAP